MPILDDNKLLKNKISQQQKLQQYLINSNTKLKNNKLFKTLNINNAKTIIDRQFSNIKKTSKIQDDKIIITIKSQNFSKILTNINSLKIKYGIVAVQASFDKQKAGVVNAKLFFKHP